MGKCKLTGDEGPFVKAHIIPKALTYPATKGLPFAQSGRDYAPKKRWDSWYDPELVTAKGEKILTDLDTWAIEELRKHKLIWKSWGGGASLDSADHHPLPDSSHGVRIIEGLDTGRLRLFLLSVLWRAAASTMHEFAEVRISASNMRRLRRMILEGNSEPAHFFPASLTQLSTIGAIHNMAPIAQRKIADVRQPHGKTIPIFRFYLDGLIAHFHQESSPTEVASLGPMLLGTEPRVAVTTVTFEASWERLNLSELMREAFERWPERMRRIPGFRDVWQE
ncbi:hypothetical protein EB810_09800 [Altererythrobacter sp. FM1]|uniref:hypothetical protein n=1 Tax=Tsuneonella flava TaxID=2055955 RepID=UPI000C806F36|nr:hypothetical protein [Tsuneonella flava]ROT95375.1 hypothetical protein EB810_09800 [Altererythrobacter sp. FM1]